MKRILITGEGSYIGTSFENYLKPQTDKYQVDTVDMTDKSWQSKSFLGYDAVFHVAGIAHSDSGSISKEKEKLYYEVNTDLTITADQKAKADGVRQFIFMSSAIVFGDSAPIGKRKAIDKNSKPSPANCYGNSKLLAEKGLSALKDNDFKVVIVRAPMIYGKGSKGNYPVLSKFARKFPVFPLVDNERSMLYIENLCEFIRLVIDNEEDGIFYPQNAEYSNTSYLVKMIAEAHGQKVFLIRGFSYLLKLASYKVPMVNKAFGNLCYDTSLSLYKDNYQIYSLKESIEKTEADI